MCAVFKFYIANLSPSLNSTPLRLFLILLYPAPNNPPELIVIGSVFGAKLEDGLIFLQIGRRPQSECTSKIMTVQLIQAKCLTHGLKHKYEWSEQGVCTHGNKM